MENSLIEDDVEVEVQDNEREDQLIRLFGLKKLKGRAGADAIDEFGHLFEIKSTTKGGVGTGRDVSIEMLNEWRNRYWIIAKGKNFASGYQFEKIYFLSPSMIEGAFKKIEDTITPDLNLKDKVIRILSNQIPRQFSSDELEKINYLMARGSTKNNPHISWIYIKEYGILIENNHADTLKRLMREN